MTIKDGKKDTVTKKNKLISETEKQLSKLNYSISSSEGEVATRHILKSIKIILCLKGFCNVMFTS